MRGLREEIVRLSRQLTPSEIRETFGIARRLLEGAAGTLSDAFPQVALLGYVLSAVTEGLYQQIHGEMWLREGRDKAKEG